MENEEKELPPSGQISFVTVFTIDSFVVDAVVVIVVFDNLLHCRFHHIVHRFTVPIVGRSFASVAPLASKLYFAVTTFETCR